MLLKHRDHNFGIARGTMPTNQEFVFWLAFGVRIAASTTWAVRSCRQINA